MLVIGDKAIKLLNPNRGIKKIEIIYCGDYANYIKSLYKLKNKVPNKINNIITSYDLKNKQKLVLYNANKSRDLKNLLENTLSTGIDFKIASPKILYIFEFIKLFYRFKNVFIWEKAVLDYNYLLKTYILPMKQHENNVINELNYSSAKFKTIFFEINQIDNSYFVHEPFSTYFETDLLEIFSSSTKNNFNNLSYGRKGWLIKQKWEDYTLEEKISAILEKAYTNAVNDYILPKWKETKKYPKNTTELFKCALMDMVNTSIDSWFDTFIICHYNIILSKFNKNYWDIFNNAKKYGDLVEI